MSPVVVYDLERGEWVRTTDPAAQRKHASARLERIRERCRKLVDSTTRNTSPAVIVERFKEAEALRREALNIAQKFPAPAFVEIAILAGFAALELKDATRELEQRAEKTFP